LVKISKIIKSNSPQHVIKIVSSELEFITVWANEKIEKAHVYLH